MTPLCVLRCGDLLEHWLTAPVAIAKALVRFFELFVYKQGNVRVSLSKDLTFSDIRKLVG